MADPGEYEHKIRKDLEILESHKENWSYEPACKLKGHTRSRLSLFNRTSSDPARVYHSAPR
jgi:hypothetical protein